jgi:hypothetical protein
LRRRAAALYQDRTSRVTGDCHARICEGLGVKFPGSTRRATRANESATDDSFACRVIDEGRPLGVVVQAKAPNYLPLLRFKERGSEQRRLKGPEVNRVK